MNKLSLITSAAGIALLLGSAVPALAHDDSNSGDDSVNVSASTSVHADGKGERIGLPGLLNKFRVGADASTSARVHTGDKDNHDASSTEKRMEKGQEHGANAIDARIKSLQELSARLANIKLLPADVLASVQATLQAEIDKLVALKAQIGADTDTETLKNDLKSITAGNRVYLLVEPKARIAASASRIDAVVTQLTTFGTKLQDRITAAQTAGVDVSAAVTAKTDYDAKIADAKVKADAAVSETQNLTVDNGDKTIQAANTAALKDARAKLEAAEADLKAARKDAMTIIGVVKVKATAESH